MPPPGSSASSRTPSNHASHTSLARAPASSGSQTVTATPSPEPDLVLRLRGAHDRRPRIQWAEGTVDNEGLGRKKSKVCCIYHKERAVGESSDESSDSSDDSSSGDDDGRVRRVGGRKEGEGKEDCGHGHGHGHNHGKEKGKGKGKKDRRKPSPNAYERMPKYDIRSLKAVAVDKAGV
jgi:protein phosphatase 1 regulatory subunit 11